MGRIEQIEAQHLSRTAPLSLFTDVALWRGLVSAELTEEAHKAWLKLFCAQIDLMIGPLAGKDLVVRDALLALGPPDSDRYVRVARHGPSSEESLLLAEAAERAMLSRRAIIQPGGTPNAACQIAQPLLIEDRLFGVVAVELVGEAQAHLEPAMRLSQWAIAWFGWRLKAVREAVDKSQDLRGTLEAARRATSGPSVVSGSEALATQLADDLGAMRVLIGVRRHLKTRLLATSHGGFSKVTTTFLETALAAMDEAVDAARAIHVPLNASEATFPHLAHLRLLRVHDADWAVSVPWEASRDSSNPNRIVLSALGRGPLPTDLEAQLSNLSKIVAPILAAREEADQPMSRRLLRGMAGLLRQMPLFLLGIAAIGLVIAAGIFVKLDYQVSGDASIEGTIRRSIVAPFDGYLATADVRPGDRVLAGARLGSLDDRELKLQKLDLEARLAETSKQIDEAVGQRDPAKVNILSARRDQVRAQLTEVSENLERTVLTAPFDGYIVSGDKTQSIGSPLRRGDTLYELSPLDGFRVAIDVPQADFSAIKLGQSGQLVLASLPFDTFSFVVQRLSPQATAHEGKTVFRVEAKLSQVGGLVRPGMQGVAHVKTEPKSVGWIYTHGVVDWLRLKLWAIFP